MLLLDSQRRQIFTLPSTSMYSVLLRITFFCIPYFPTMHNVRSFLHVITIDDVCTS